MKSGHIIFIVLLIVIASQISTFYLIDIKIEETLSALNNTKDALDKKINTTNENFQSRINTITASVVSLSSTQTDLQEEIGKVKARSSSDFSNIFENEKRGIVTIRTDTSQGTGFILTEDGYITTNNHVIEEAEIIQVVTYDGDSHSASRIGVDEELDVALLKIKGNFEIVKIGDSDKVKIGEKVIAIGNPFGLDFTLTEGIISARDRTGINDLPYYFQIDVPLNPGNSGGPLINTDGEVIGINNFKVIEAENLGFALEINKAIEAVNSIASQAINRTII